MKTIRYTCVWIALLLSAALLAGAAAEDAQGRRLIGDWLGTVARQHLAIKIEQAADGSYSGKFTAVDQGITLPLDTVSASPGGALRLELKTAGAVYEGKLSEGGDEIVGKWQQSGASIALTLRRPGAAPAKSTLTARTIGRLAFEPCRTPDGNTEGLCGTYDVFENRQSRQGRRIGLKILVLPALAATPAPDPWFALAGGPGQSAIEPFPSVGFTGKVREHRDVVLVDQRGTGGSNALSCEVRDPNDRAARIAGSISLDRVRACRAELEKRADLTQYTTSIAADDLEDVRQAMGYDKINLFGGSYGSTLALVYVRRHGEHVRTVAMSAVAPPQFRVFLEFARTLQSSINRTIAACAADPVCQKAYAALKEEFQSLLASVTISPAHFELDTPSGKQAFDISHDMLMGGLRSMMYIPQILGVLPYAIHSASEGDWRAFLEAALAAKADNGVYRGMFFSVICAEDMPGITEKMVRDTTSGTYMGEFYVRMYQNACREWPRAAIPSDFYAPVRSAVPALFISGALDPVTPPEVSAQQARDLTNSRVVVLRQGTHGTSSACLDSLIANFVEQGSAASLDVSCADSIHLPPFQVPSPAPPKEGAR